MADARAPRRANARDDPELIGTAHAPGTVLHRCSSIDHAQTTSEQNIPVTKPQRTLEDLRRELSAGELRRALREAEFLALPVWRFTLVGDRAGDELELSLLGLCRRHRLPEPEVNAMVGPFEVDFVWRKQRLVVEVDGYDAHRGSVAFDLDHRRDAWLIAHGYTVLRFTYRQLGEEATAVAALIRQQLGNGPVDL